MQDFDAFYISIWAILFLTGLGLWRLYKGRKQFSRPPRILVVIWNIFLSFFLIVGLFLAMESYYRFFIDRTDSFGLNKISTRWQERHYQLNQFKARDNIEYALKIAPGKRRISFLGDSFTAGHGVEEVEKRFSNLIRQNLPGTEIHNLGVNGFESVDQLTLLDQLLGQGYELDLVVLVYTLNDISPFTPETEVIYERINQQVEEMGFWTKNSYFLNTLYFQQFAASEPAIANYYSYLSDSYKGASWRSQQDVLRQIQARVSENGGELRVITFPFLQEMGADYTFDSVHEHLGKFWYTQGVPHLDLFHIFAAYQGANLVVNPYDAHPNEQAHAIASAAIMTFLQQ